MDFLINFDYTIYFSFLKYSLYIDPGTASAVMAAIIGAVAGVGMTLKLYWFKIKQKIIDININLDEIENRMADPLLDN